MKIWLKIKKKTKKKDMVVSKATFFKNVSIKSYYKIQSF